MLALQIDNPKLESLLQRVLPKFTISSESELLQLAEAIKNQQSIERGLSDIALDRVSPIEEVETEMYQLVEKVCK